MLEGLFEQVGVYQAALGGLSTRQRAIAENVANADTPGYMRKEVGFERALRSAIRGEAAGEDFPLLTSQSRHFGLGPLGSGVEPTVTTVRDEVYRNDGNNVDVEAQMAELAETRMRYDTMATLARGKFEGLKGLLRDVR